MSCVDGQWSTDCVGEQTPAAEDFCDPKVGCRDDNCDGRLSGEHQGGFVIGGAGIQEVQDMATDSQGNIFLIGRFSEQLIVPGRAEPILQEPGTALNMFILKLSPTGQHLWHRTYGYPDANFPTPGSQYVNWLRNFCYYGNAPRNAPACRIAVDGHDDLIVTGPLPVKAENALMPNPFKHIVGSYDLHAGTVDGPNAQAGFVFVAKYAGVAKAEGLPEAEGALVWSETIQGSPFHDRITDMALRGPDDEIVLSGHYRELESLSTAEPIIVDKGCAECWTPSYHGQDLFFDDQTIASQHSQNGFVFAIDSGDDSEREILWKASIQESPPTWTEENESSQSVVSLAIDPNDRVTLTAINVRSWVATEPAPRLKLVFHHGNSSPIVVPLGLSGGDHNLHMLNLDTDNLSNLLTGISTASTDALFSWQDEAVILAHLDNPDATLIAAGGFANTLTSVENPATSLSSTNGTYDAFLTASGKGLLPQAAVASGNATIHETTLALATHGPHSFYQLISLPYGYGPESGPAQGQHIGFNNDEFRCEIDAAHSHCLVRWSYNPDTFNFEVVWTRSIGASVAVDQVGALDGDGRLTTGMKFKTVINNGHGHTRLVTNSKGDVLVAGNFRGDLLTPVHHDQHTSRPESSASLLSNPSEDSDVYVLHFSR